MSVWYEKNINLRNPLICFEIKNFHVPHDDPKIEQLEQIASYNLSEDGIVVPGIPKVYFDNRRHKKTLKRDTGLRMIDENSAMFGDYPMDPLFYSCNNQAEHLINYQEIDIVTDRLNLRNIYYSLYIPDVHSHDPYRIDIRRIGNCIIFFPVHKSTRESADVGDPTYNDDFKQSFTKCQNEAVTGTYFKINKFQFGQITILMRFPLDCVEELDKRYQKNEPFDTVHQYLPNSEKKAYQWGLNKSHSLVMLKTRVFPKAVRPLTWFCCYVSGISKLVVAKYDNLRDDQGANRAPINVEERSIVKVQPIDVQKDRLPANLHMLHNCLNALIDLVRKSDEGKVFALLWTPDEYDILKLYETINPALCCDVCDEIKFSI